MTFSGIKDSPRPQMNRVQEFYTKSAAWMGTPSLIADHDRARAASIERLCGEDVTTVLELGAGDGATAAAMSDLGYDVVAMEFSPLRVAQARRFVQEPRRGMFIILDENFYEVDLNSNFDVVCYWDGFGVGSDSDQRRLLRRIAREWIAPGGGALIDVFSPWWWAQRSGEEFRLRDGSLRPDSVEMISRYDFDLVGSRFINTRYPVGAESQAVIQSIRCYTPADLTLLLEGTGLKIGLIEAAGRTLGMDSLSQTPNSPLWESGSYLVKLVADSSL